MICKNCGKTIADHTTFCPFCGAVQSEKKETEETLPAMPGLTGQAEGTAESASNSSQTGGYGPGDPRAMGYGQGNSGGYGPGDPRAAGFGQTDPNAYGSYTSQPQNPYVNPYGDPNQEQYYSENGTLSSRATAVIAYMTWIGFLIAFALGDRTPNGRFYLNQALVYHLFALPLLLVFTNSVILMAFALGIWLPLVAIWWFIGLTFAIAQNSKRLPIVGRITLIK